GDDACEVAPLPRGKRRRPPLREEALADRRLAGVDAGRLDRDHDLAPAGHPPLALADAGTLPVRASSGSTPLPHAAEAKAGAASTTAWKARMMGPMPVKPGDVLEGRFEIERSAGRGGAGVVYRGRDRETGAAVAVKTSHAEVVEAELRRFEREAETLAG